VIEIVTPIIICVVLVSNSILTIVNSL